MKKLMRRGGFVVFGAVLVFLAITRPENLRQVEVTPLAQKPAPSQTAFSFKHAVPYAGEFWRKPAPDAPRNSKNASAPFNVNDVIDRAAHAWESHNNVLAVHSAGYVAKLSGSEMVFEARDSATPETSATARIKTARIQHGDRDLGLNSAAWETFGNIAQRAHGEIVEHLESRREGVSITWVLPEPLAQGALEIDAQVSGVTHTGSNANGNYFKSGDVGVRVGNATAVDSTGRRWALATMRIDNDLLRISVPSEIIAQANYPLAIDPLISPEFSVPLGVGPSRPDQTQGAVAFNGSIYVAVWTEFSPDGARMRIARLDTSGEVIDTDQFVTNAGFLPHIASNGSEFLIAYRDGMTQNVICRKLDQNGSLTDQQAIVGNISHFRALACRGTDYLLVAMSDGVQAYRIGANLTVTKVMEVFTPTTGYPAVATDGTDYLVLWTQSAPNTIRGARVTPANEVIQFDVAVATTQSVNTPTIAYSGAQYLAAWTVNETTPAGLPAADIRAVRLNAAGVRVGAEIQVETASGQATVPTLSPLGNGFVCAWVEFLYEPLYTAKVYAQKIAADGSKTGAAFVLSESVANSAYGLAGSARGPAPMFVWEGNLAGASRSLFARIVPVEGNGGPEKNVTTGPSLATAPAVAYGANGYLVVWQDNRNAFSNRHDIYGIYVDVKGIPKTSSAIPISTEPQEQTSPSVAAAADHYLVVWRDGNQNESIDDIKGCMLVGNDAGPTISICTETNSQRAPVVATNAKGDAPAPRDFLVVWRDNRDQFVSDDIYGAHLAFTGHVLSPANGFAICVDTNDQTAPVVASNGTNFLVAWRDYRNLATDFSSDVYGALVEPLSIQLPADFVIGAAPGHQRAPEVASNGADYFVVWRDDRNNNSANPIAIYGTPVTADGLVSRTTGYALVSGAPHQREPAISSLGGDYLLTWLQDAATTQFIFNPFYRVIRSDGALLTPASRLSSKMFNGDVLTSASGEDGSVLVASETLGMESTVVGQQICIANCPVTVSVSVQGGVPTLTWNVLANTSYIVQYRANFTTDTWHDFPAEIASEDGFLQFTDTSAAGQPARFYRIVQFTAP